MRRRGIGKEDKGWMEREEKERNGNRKRKIWKERESKGREGKRREGNG